MNTHDRLCLLEVRARALPFALRCLRAREDGLQEGQERADDLLAELDLLLVECLRGPRRDLRWMDDAEQSIEVKARVYALARHFMAQMGATERVLQGFEVAARRDLRYSRWRLQKARCGWPVERPVWAWA